MSAKVQVIFYSTYGHVWRLAEAVAEGARAVGATVELLRVAETLPADVLARLPGFHASAPQLHRNLMNAIGTDA